MERKDFLKICGGSCLGLIGISSVLQSCATHFAQGTFSNNQLLVSKNDFVKVEKEKTTYRKYILVKSEKLDFPLVVYRVNDLTYTALLLSCTHQGNELSVNGNILTCNAHGSEFSSSGEVIQGPAEQKLKSYPVTSDEKNIYIQIQ